MVEPAVGAGDLALAGWPPMALALEGVARQGQALLGKGGMEGAPIDGQTAQVQLGQDGSSRFETSSGGYGSHGGAPAAPIRPAGSQVSFGDDGTSR